MTVQWDFYMCRVDHQPASIYLDMGLARKAPLKNFLWMAYLRLYMSNPRSDGLSSREEFDSLVAIEEELVKQMRLSTTDIYVGRNTNNGCRDFYFYTADVDEWSKKIETVLSSFPAYDYETGTRNDPEWHTYHNFLYPSGTDMQRMKDRRVLEQLEKQGDSLVQPREIRHWAYFPNMIAMKAFEAKTKGLGFNTINYLDPDEQNSSYGICITREDLPSYGEISDVTLPLYRLAEECNGRYDGWETQVVR